MRVDPDGAPHGPTTPSRRTLAGQASDLLAAGPLHTLALAREVLRLEGNPGAASAAVFALIGDDPRFTVDAGGLWSLRGDPLGPTLAELSFAVVDVETTGGRPAQGDRITDIAIVEVRGGEVVDTFTTLVNPGRAIPPVVRRITGIDEVLVADAPHFEDVAPEVQRRLLNRVFVAHNVTFDLGFVRAELTRALGDADLGPPLCTVRMARGLLPRLRRRNLDALALHYGIPIHARHRAHGDALATARILLRLLDEAAREGGHDLQSLNRILQRRNRQRSRRTPRHTPREDEP